MEKKKEKKKKKQLENGLLYGELIQNVNKLGFQLHVSITTKTRMHLFCLFLSRPRAGRCSPQLHAHHARIWREALGRDNVLSL